MYFPSNWNQQYEHGELVRILAFKPSRWEGNESNTLQDEHWFGFGQGPRACPGTHRSLGRGYQTNI